MDAAWMTTIVTWLTMSIRMSIPLLFPSLGGLISQKAGVFNFGLEGMMLCGAYFGYYGSYVTGSPWIGLLLGMISGGLLGLLLAFTSIHLRVSQLVTGLGIGVFSLGITGYLFRLIGISTATSAATLFSNVNFGELSSIPIFGEIFLSHNWMVYAGFVLVILIAWFFFHTTPGLNFRAVGENPQVADTAGVNVIVNRYLAVVVSGILASMGGAFLTLTQTAYFTENISAGRGWIAISAIVLGKFNPWGVLLACLLFGAADAAQMQIQVMNLGIPYQFLLMTPYILAMLAMVGFVGKVRSPAAMGKPYVKH
ncbi:MAG: ABC transporter permease [Chloroflexi bacterium HGW-Chloroflexi-2]|jgi:simple sugar transport system permease protein|nr:MAG: ABC transporter permease [Chloroflexi bacterium HGW-Chloroflexi-2]